MEKNKENLTERPPVVVMVGHIDHGKSSLLEIIRKDLSITKRESGGITQRIGVYEVSYKDKKITFIDTPGHEAFSAMRSRGAKVADIAVLVIAATEGVKAQTKEAIAAVKQAGISMIVALNKIDKPQANPEKTKEDLAAYGVLVESKGGKIPSQNVSAKTGEGVKDLLDIILLVAEMENLKTDTSKPAEGVIIESFLDEKRGPMATLIPKKGVLKRGEIIATPSALGKIKNLEDFQGKPLAEVLPSQPAILLGFEKSPQVGERFKVFQSRKEAISEMQRYQEKSGHKSQISLSSKPDSDERRILNIIIKTDTLGSLEAIQESLKEIPQEKIGLKIIKGTIGNIQATDIKLARSAKAEIFGFKVKVAPEIKNLLRPRETLPKIYQVIYEFIQAVRESMEKRLKPQSIKVDLGKVKILAVFKIEKNKNRQIIGGRVIAGVVENGRDCEIIRNEEKIGEGKILNLQEKKKNIRSVSKGDECGMLFSSPIIIEEGDIINVYKMEKTSGGL